MSASKDYMRALERVSIETPTPAPQKKKLNAKTIGLLVFLICLLIVVVGVLGG